jgi:anti-anti-sigma factor
MDIKITAQPACTVLSLGGRLEATQAGEVQAAVEKAIKEGPPNLVLDCAGLSYVASMGLRCFMLAQKLTREAKGKAVFTGLNDNVRMIFDLTGFDKLVQVLGSVEEALALFQKP